MEQSHSSWECLRLPGFGVPTWDVANSILQFQLVLVFFLTQSLHHCAFKHIGLPPLVSQMMVGVLLSALANQRMTNELFAIIFPKVTSSVWKTMGLFGCILSTYMMVAKVDYGIVWKTGRKSYVIGLLGFFLPFGVNAITIFLMNNNPVKLEDGNMFYEHETLTSSITASTHIPVITCLLSDLDMLNSEVGRLAVSIALVTEIGGTVFLVIGDDYKGHRWLFLVGPVVITLVAMFVFRPCMKKMIQQTPKDRPVKTALIALVFLFGLVSGIETTITSTQFVYLGFFILGVVTPAGPPLTSTFVRIFDPFVHGILQPFFVTVCIMRADVFTIDFSDVAQWQRMTIFILPNIVRLCLCMVSTLFTEMSVTDGIILGLILDAKGFIDLAIYSNARQSMKYSAELFTTMVFLAMVMAIIVPLLVKILYNPSRKYAGYQKRDIIHLKQSNELSILPCIYRTDNTTAITNLLDICNPTMNNPIAANILHLENLDGCSQPIFISHDLQTKKSSSQRFHSDDISIAFEKYRNKRHQGGLTTHLFTAVTLTKAMHEDICTLALNTNASLIILPFHRKIGIDGSIDSEFGDQRSLNQIVLDYAPCSVAVHVNRGLTRKSPNKSTHQEQSNYPNSSITSSNATTISIETADVDSDFNVAVVFIGGHDDLEAVALSKRMARGTRVRIHLVRLMAEHSDDCKNKDEVDSMVIEYIRTGEEEYKKKINYEEITVKDGGETAAIMKAMANDFDLMIVGRRYGSECQQTAGLNEWSEVRELGVIGDLLASPDLRGRTSVLIVQRQKQR